MRTVPGSRIALALAFALPLALAACAPAPIYKTAAGFVAATPDQVATAPQNFAHAQVVWGGEVIGVDNFKDDTRLRILGYPLDSSQRPRFKQPTVGRFIAVVPGFLDPMNFPSGTPVTVRGRIEGAQVLPVGQATYTYTSVSVGRADLHRWSASEMHRGHPNISIGVGVGGWIH